jgi:single-strand DNA-binding protein
VAASLNRVKLIGWLGADPEVKQLAQGVVCSFRVATNTRQRDGAGGTQEENEWIVVEVWGRQAELCPRFLTRASLVGVEGQLHTRSCGDDENGQRCDDTNVRATDVMFLDSPEHDDTTSAAACVIEDLPFSW